MTSMADLAWAAGLFEGEGTVTRKRGKGTAHRWQAAVIMTDEDVLRKFSEVVGIGRFYGPYQPKNPAAKPIWRWTTTKKDEVEKLFGLIGAWLGERRRAKFELSIADSRGHLVTSAHFLKLSPALHVEIRSRYMAGGITQEHLGREYGVTQSAVSIIVRKPGVAAVEAVSAPKLNVPKA